MRTEPYTREMEASVTRRMEQRGSMPRTLPALIAWYIGAVADELPERLHKGEVWSDRVTLAEWKEGKRSEGGSALGSPALSTGMRQRLEGSPSQTDEDGYYRFPVWSALSRMHRRDPEIAKDLTNLARCEGDWDAWRSSVGIPRHIAEVYLRDALRSLWLNYHDQVRLAA